MERLSITHSSLIFKIETSIRFWDEKDYEEGIFSILSSARTWMGVILAGKRDSRRHSTAGFSENDYSLPSPHD